MRALSDVPIIVVSSGDLTSEQHQQLLDFGQQLINKSSLGEKELIANLEQALQRVKAD